MQDFLLPTWNLEEGTAGRPKYERLREHFLIQLREGRLKPGASLPSEQRLAEMWGVARNTVRQAMASLEEEGVVSRIHGKGTFVCEQAGQRLKTASRLFAAIVPETQDGFYPSLLKSFATAANDVHHQVIVCSSDNDVDRQGNAILQLIDREVAGVAVVPTTTPATPVYQMRQLQKHGIPVVFCSRRVEGVRAPLIGIPFDNIGYRAGEAILRAGHRQVAFIGTHRSRASLAYEAGFQRAIQELAGVPVSFQSFFGTASSPDMAQHAPFIAETLERTVFKAPVPLTAIFAGFDSLAELIYLQLLRGGVRVPEDISLVSFGGSYRATIILNQLSAVTIDEIQMGVQAVSLLERMRTGELPIELETVCELPLSMNPGMTLQPPSGSS